MNGTVEMQAEKIIPKGYKLTEAGVIPEDWDVRKIGDIAEVIRGASPRPKGDKRFYGGNIPREGANKRGNSSRLTQSFHFFMFEPIFSPVNALNQPI